MSRIRTYSEMAQLPTFSERFQYLSLGGDVGATTFGFDRYLNQKFYKSREWRDVRWEVIARDESRDLSCYGYEIFDKNDVYIHHMNPMVKDDIIHGNMDTLDPEYLITVTHRTHNAIHYGDVRQVPRQLTVRTPNDTTPWKR